MAEENLNQDVPGCEDNYYRCVISILRITRGWINLISTLGLIIISITSTLAASTDMSEDVIQVLNIIIAVMSSIITGTRVFRDYSLKAEMERHRDLRRVISNA